MKEKKIKNLIILQKATSKIVMNRLNSDLKELERLSKEIREEFEREPTSKKVK